MRHWADVDGDFLTSESVPTRDPKTRKTDGEHSEDGEDGEPRELLQSHGSASASPADDWAQEILQDIEQFGHPMTPNVLDRFTVMLLKRAQSRRNETQRKHLRVANLA